MLSPAHPPLILSSEASRYSLDETSVEPKV